MMMMRNTKSTSARLFVHLEPTCNPAIPTLPRITLQHCSVSMPRVVRLGGRLPLEPGGSSDRRSDHRLAYRR